MAERRLAADARAELAGGGWLLITISLARLPAALTSLLLIVQPLVSVLLAALIFSDSPSGIQLIGVVLVLMALLVATAPRRRRAPVYAIAGASGSRSSAASISASENSGSSSRPARKAS
jgi:hypothetical protein